MAVHQGQGTQGLQVAHRARDQHRSGRACIERDRLAVVAAAVQGFGKRDVGPCGQSAIVGGVKRGAACGDRRIISNVNRVRAAGAHSATAERAAASGIGLKVSRCVREANRACVGGGTAVVHQHTAGGIQRIAKRDAHTCERGGAGGCAAHIDRAVVGLCKAARVHAAAVEGGVAIHRQAARRSDRTVQGHAAGVDSGRAAKAHGVAKVKRRRRQRGCICEGHWAHKAHSTCTA